MAETHLENTSLDFQEIFERTFSNLRSDFAGKVIVDIPAGQGRTSTWLQSQGAQVIPLDLFPEFFKSPGLTCQPCDLNDLIPLPDHAADYIVSQEGIEHVSDQYRAMSEFSRVLKLGGRLLLTSPNGSALSLKMAHLLGESEKYARIMPPNTVDSIWFSSQSKESQSKLESKLYFGHLFIPTASKLRVLGLVAGLKLEKVHFSEFKASNFFWFPFLYPLILLSQSINLIRNLLAKPKAAGEYKQAFWLSIHPLVLLDGSLVLEFKKVDSPKDSQRKLHEKWRSLQTITP